MTRHLLSIVAAAIFAPLLCAVEPAPVVVSHIKVLSDKVPDFSSLESWKRSVIKEGMSDEEKAMAVWSSVVSFQHQDTPPSEFLQSGDNVLDPLKMANVYGYSFCSVTTANLEALARAVGLPARGWTINAHVVPELFWDGSWHLLDASLINYFPKADKRLASVEEIVADVKAWYAAHPEFKGNEAKLREFMRGGGWRNGPEIFRRSPSYDENGWLPAATHGWYSSMQEYDGSTLFAFEPSYSMGYQVNVQLRPGERLIRNWSNRGGHIDMDRNGDGPGCMKEKTGEGSLRYTPKFGDLAPGRVGNGALEYTAPLGDAAFLKSALEVENLATGGKEGRLPALHVKDPAKPGQFVVRFPSSYVYLGGELLIKPVIAEGGKIAVELSDNHGLDWRPLATLTKDEERIDLKPHIFRRYDYRLRFTMEGAGTGLAGLAVRHEIQHSQRPLPALVAGTNAITFQSGLPEGTITIEGSTEPKNQSKQLTVEDFHPVAENLEPGSIRPKGRTGSITFPVRTPGDLSRVRVHTFYRARGEKDAWEIAVSFDGGKTFRSADKLSGPHVGFGKSTLIEGVPSGTREALVRYTGTQANTLVAFNIRIDADYREPHGGFRPVKVAYVWEENGAEKRHEHVARKAEERYAIECGTKPIMKSLTVELAE